MSLPAPQQASTEQPASVQPSAPPDTFLERCALIFGSGGLVISTWAALIVGGFLVVTLLGLLLMLLAEVGVLKWLLLFAAAAGGLGWYIYTHHEEPPPQPLPIRQRMGGVYGDAGYADFQSMLDLKLLPEGGDFTRAIYLGEYLNWYIPPGAQFERTSRHVGYTGQNNILTVAPAGSGKFTTTIAPTLMLNEESMFVVDVKGESFAVTSHHRAGHLGHRIVPINPFNMFGQLVGAKAPLTAYFNPLARLHPDDPDFVTQIDALAAAMILQEGNDPHWPNRARDLLACLMAHVCSDPEERAKGWNTLPRVRYLLGRSRAEFSAYMEQCRSSPVDKVRNLAGSFADSSNREIPGIISTALGQLSFLDQPQIARFLSKSTFDFADLRREPLTIYFMLPPNELNTYYRFARLIVQACLNALSVEPKPGDRSVLLLLDEQAQLRHMESIEGAIALLRGYRTRIWSVLQDLSQLEATFGKRWESFVANAGIVQVFTTNDQKTAEYFSRKAGTYTGYSISESEGTSTGATRSSNPSGGNSSSNSGSSTGTNRAMTAVPLLSPQQFYSLPNWQGVLFVHGSSDVVPVHKLPYWEQPALEGAWLPNPFHDAGGFRYAWIKERIAAEVAGRPFPPREHQQEAA